MQCFTFIIIAVRAILCVDKATEGVVKLSGFDGNYYEFFMCNCFIYIYNHAGNLEACKMELELAKISCHTKDDVISKLQKDNQAMQDKSKSSMILYSFRLNLKSCTVNTQPTLLPVNKAIQANYLAVAPG